MQRLLRQQLGIQERRSASLQQVQTTKALPLSPSSHQNEAKLSVTISDIQDDALQMVHMIVDKAIPASYSQKKVAALINAYKWRVPMIQRHQVDSGQSLSDV